MSFLVEKGDALILLDAGTGVRRFGEGRAKEILDRHQEVHVVLSHFHADHIIGFTFFPLYFFNKKVIIHGPCKSVTGMTTKEALNTFLQHPIFPIPLNKFPMETTVQDLKEGTTRIAGLDVHVQRQEHSDPTIGIRIGDELCYITDTGCRQKTIPFVREVKVMLHECWVDREDQHAMEKQGHTVPEPGKVLKMHSHSDGVAEIARDADVGRLGLIHLNPRYSEDRCRRMARECAEIFPRTLLVEDGQMITIE